MPRPTCFKQVYGPMVPLEYPVAASVAFKALSGKFVSLDSSNQLAITTATGIAVIGWADSIGLDFTASSSAGQDKVVVNIAADAVYEMPLASAYTEANLQAVVGETCDISVSSNIQYANIAAATYSILEIVGYKYYGSASGQQTVLVRLNAAVRTAKGAVA